MKELESEASGLQRTVGSLWERLETPLEDQQKVLEKVESFRLRDIEVVSGHSRTTLYSACSLSISYS